MQRRLASILIPLTVLAVASAINAQVKSRWGNCPVIVEVFDVKTGLPVAGARATAENWGNDAKFVAVTRNGMPHFSGLEDFQHLFSVTAPGYKRTTTLTGTGCDEGIKGTAIVSVYMWKGPASETVRMEDQSYTVPPYHGRYGKKVLLQGPMVVDRGRLTVTAPDYANAVMVGNGGNSTGPVESPMPKRMIDGDDLTSKAINLPPPEYDHTQRKYGRASTLFKVDVIVNESGDVVSAELETGLWGLKPTVKAAAMKAKFAPAFVNGEPTGVKGFLIYEYDRSNYDENGNPTVGVSKASPNTLSTGVLNAKVITMPKPVYPRAAKDIKAQGPVTISVLVDTEGNVISTLAVSGPPALWASAEAAARGAKLSPTLVRGNPVNVVGDLVITFTP